MRGWGEHDVLMAARRVLDEMLERLAMIRIGATGEVGDANPVPRRMAVAYPELPVTHIVAEEALVG